ncbi:MAG: Uma2 family endonuclease [Thermomicrobia bacterium]|nr:Uma2 family endonuclease [Thermomicrobia bacterium]MCA1722697.1 Uma2 family endonuclease [Thermomicrobia bacterium]
MPTKTEATIDDLMHAPDDAMYELINGKVVRMSPTGFLPSRVASEIFVALRAYERQTRSGYAMSDGIAYIVNLPHRRSFSPDASIARTAPENKMGFVDGAPLFAAEVRSEGDYGNAANRAYQAKRAEYFAAGTVVVWDVDPVASTAASYRADRPDTPTRFNLEQIADAEPALPGWRVAVSDIFG